MLHAGLDLSRKRLDVCLLTEHAELIDHVTAPPDGDGLCALARRVAPFGVPVRGVIESMNAARFVRDDHGRRRRPWPAAAASRRPFQLVVVAARKGEGVLEQAGRLVDDLRGAGVRAELDAHTDVSVGRRIIDGTCAEY